MRTHSYPIALVMIVRDEARCLARCLESARDWVDEMLVLDTGSADATADIARHCGARIAEMRWPDDFAAARNHALSMVDTPWRLVLDADEWIHGGTALLEALRQQPPEFVGLVSVSSQVSDDAGLVQTATSWLPRVLPRGAVYEGRIHEQPVSRHPHRRLGLHIEHDGYLPAQMQLKLGRNYRLLQAALRDRPHDAYLAYQLGTDCEAHGRFAESLPHYEAAYRAGDAQQAPWRHALVMRLLFILKKLGRFDEALKLAADEQPMWPESPDFYFTLGDVLLDAALANPARANEWVPMIEQAWLRAIEIGERPDLMSSVAGRGSFLAAHNLAAFHTALGHAEQAAHWGECAALWRAASSRIAAG